LQLKRLGFLDILREQTEREAQDADEQFDVDFVLMAGELAQLLRDLVASLGGELKPV
jgi:recombination associated protein RdgC